MFNRFMGKSAAAAKEGAGQPLQLVSYDESTKKFTVGEEALKVLKSVRAPMGVVSVCGRARQGKSFILNQLLGQSSGFTVAPTHRPCTKGLWMWSSPVEQVGPDGSKHYLVCSPFDLAHFRSFADRANSLHTSTPRHLTILCACTCGERTARQCLCHNAPSVLCCAA